MQIEPWKSARGCCLRDSFVWLSVLEMVDQWSLTADREDYDYSSTEFTLKISTNLLLGECLCIVVLFDGGSVVVYYRQIKTADFTLDSERFCRFRDSSV